MQPEKALSVVKQNSLVPMQHEMSVFQVMAAQAYQSKLYRGIGDEAAVMTIMLAARELGIPPMSALNGGLHIIKGKVEVSARMMSALIRRAGHSIQVEKLDDSECVLKGTRDDGDSMTAGFTMDEAKRAGLITQGSGWVKFPQDMLFARALSRLARRLFSDVIGVAYVEGEIGAEAAQSQREETCVEILGDRQAKLIQAMTEDAELKEYVNQIKEKFGVEMEDIAMRYVDYSSEFKDKFDAWKEKRMQKKS